MTKIEQPTTRRVARMKPIRKGKYTIEDALRLLNGYMTDSDKPLGKILVENGILSYTKLTPKNYDYWWYETPKPCDANPSIYTYSWDDIEVTRKFERFFMLLPFHNLSDDIFSILNVLSQIESTNQDLTLMRQFYNVSYRVHEAQYQQQKLFEK